jgi:predicted RND superfamily exporter protein
MKSFLRRRDRWGHGVSVWLLAGIVFLLPLIGWSLSHIRLENDVAGWLPKNDPQSKILDWYQRLFPNEERILLSWDDCSLTDERIQRLAELLEGVAKPGGAREGGSPYISEVKRPHDLLKRMMREGIPFRTALDRTHGLLVGDGALCIQLTGAGRLRGEYMPKEVLRLANDQMHLGASLISGSLPAPVSDGLAADDEAGWKLHDELTEYVQSIPLHDLKISWPRMHIDRERTEEFRRALLKLEAPEVAADTSDRRCVEEAFFVRGAMAAVSVGLTEAAEEDRNAALAFIRSSAEACGIPEPSLHMGGRTVASTALNQAVKNAGWNRAFPLWDLPQRSPILLSVLVTVVLSMVLLRSFRLTILVQVVSLLCAVACVALVPVTGGSMNMVLVVMPTLLVVITTSAAIHLCNYWKNSGIDDPAESVFHSASVAWLPCFLASATTGIGLASLMVSTLVPVRDFGIYASVGCGISFLCALYVLPSLMLYWPRRPPKPEALDTTLWQNLGEILTGHHQLVKFGCLAAAVVCTSGLFYFRTETKVVRYFADDSRLARDYYFLEENLSGIVSVDTIVRFDETVQRDIPFLDRARKVMLIQDSLRQHPEVSGTLSLASFLDLSQEDTSGMTRMQRMKVKRRESDIEARVREKLAAGDDESRGLSSMLAVASAAGDLKADGDGLLNRKGDELWRITCQSSVMSDYDYAVLTKELDEITRRHLRDVKSPWTGHIVTGLIPIFLRTQQALLESLISSFGLAFVVIWIVMGIQLRSLTAAAVAMLPNIFPVAVMFGLLGWGGIRVDIGTMITASVALGIAVDGTLHMLTWFQILIQQGMTRRDAAVKSLEHCGPALWQSSAAIGLGMLALFPVELLLISRFGWIMAGMILAALIGDVIFLPALLVGRLGIILERGTRGGAGPSGGTSEPGLSNGRADTVQESADVTGSSDRGRESVAAAVGAGQTVPGSGGTLTGASLPGAGGIHFPRPNGLPLPRPAQS